MSDGRELRAQTMRGSFDFIDRPVVTFAPESLDGKGYEYNFDNYFEHIYFFGGRTSGTFDYYYAEYLEEVDTVFLMAIYGRYNSRTDSRDPNKIHVTMTGREIEFYLDELQLFSGKLKEFEDLIDQVAEIFGEPYPIPKSFNIEMNFKTFTSGTCVTTTTYSEGFDVLVDHGTFEEIDDD